MIDATVLPSFSKFTITWGGGLLIVGGGVNIQYTIYSTKRTNFHHDSTKTL